MHTTTDLAAAVLREGTPGARLAHAMLFERIVERTHRYFLRMVWNAADAEDCVQELLVLADSLEKGRYDPGYSFNAWIWLKARTVHAQWCRTREKCPRPAETAAGEVAVPSGSGAVDARLDAERIVEEVRRRLGPESAEALVLYYDGSLTVPEVARAMERDPKTVRGLLDRAHAIAREILGEPARPS